MTDQSSPGDVIALLQQQIALYQESVTAENERKDLERQRIALETERLFLEKKTEENSRNLANSEKQRVRMLVQQDEKLTSLLAFVQTVTNTVMAVREWQTDASDWMDSIDRSMIILLAKRGNGGQKEADVLIAELSVASLKRELLQRTQNLQELQEQEALGGFDLGLKNDIKKEKKRIGEIEGELKKYE
jgi:hypothetical protein